MKNRIHISRVNNNNNKKKNNNNKVHALWCMVYYPYIIHAQMSFIHSQQTLKKLGVRERERERGREKMKPKLFAKRKR